MLKGRTEIDLKEIQFVQFETNIRNIFYDKYTQLLNIFFIDSKFISISLQNEIQTIEKFENVAEIFYDE